MFTYWCWFDNVSFLLLSLIFMLLLLVQQGGEEAIRMLTDPQDKQLLQDAMDNAHNDFILK